MAQATQPRGKPAAVRTALCESAADRVSGLIVALLVFVSGSVVMLLAVWLSTVVSRPAMPGSPLVRLVPGSGGDPRGVRGDMLHVDGPERAEIAQQSDAVEPAIQETVATVTDALARQLADPDSPISTSEVESAGPVGGRRGNSNRRGPGPQGPGPEGDGPVWEIEYDETTLALYAQQLDFFGIELAVVGGSKDRIEYASGFTQGQPTRRSGTRDQELGAGRTYFTHRSGTVRQYDEQLLMRADVDWRGPGKIVLQFYPAQAEQQLLAAQEQYRGLAQEVIAKTVFGVRRRRSGFEFYVVDQVRR